jgi:hypothetical protein
VPPIAVVLSLAFCGCGGQQKRLDAGALRTCLERQPGFHIIGGPRGPAGPATGLVTEAGGSPEKDLQDFISLGGDQFSFVLVYKNAPNKTTAQHDAAAVRRTAGTPSSRAGLRNNVLVVYDTPHPSIDASTDPGGKLSVNADEMTHLESCIGGSLEGL